MSEESKTLSAIKGAILFERKGYAFYKHAAEVSSSEDVKSFFIEMANEEKEHEDFLSQIFKHIHNNGDISGVILDQSKLKSTVMPMNMEMLSQILSADYLAAAISAAIELEKKSIEHYKNAALNSDNQEAKRFFEFLSAWEATHLELLDQINKELTERIWNDNSFWPY